MKSRFVAAGVLLSSASVPALAVEMPNVSVILDGYYQNNDRAIGRREDGFGLGETELAISGAIDDQFYGKMTAVLESHDGETETELEEAFIQTMGLPAGFSIRAGRFMADLGYLNNQHLHTDSFVERPAIYRAFLGNHYFDDGLRVNWVAPTDLYWTVGVEGFDGGKLAASGLEETESVGIYHLYTKLGGDLSASSSWQVGLSWMRNENGVGHLDHDEHEHDEHEGEEHEEHEGEEHAEEGHDHAGHSHNASFTGENLYAFDAVYKWAPNGNFKNQHFTLSAEYMYLDKPFEEEGGEENIPDSYDGWYVSGVYQMSPRWSMGLRYGELSAAMAHEEAHGDHFHTHYEDAKLKETEAMIAWHNSHFSTVRLQYTNQKDDLFESKDDHIISLQFNMAIGAHGAHQF